MTKSQRLPSVLGVDRYAWTKTGGRNWDAIRTRLIHHQYLPQEGRRFRGHEMRMISHRRF